MKGLVILGISAARALATMLALFILMVALILIVQAGDALAETPNCDVGVVFNEPPDCQCPEGYAWSLTYAPGHEGDNNYITSGVCVPAYSGPGDGNPVCEVGVVFEDDPQCDCPTGYNWAFTYVPGHEGDYNYITSGVCASNATGLTGDIVPSLTGDTGSSVSASAYSTSLPSTGLPMAVLFAGGLAAAGAGMVFARRRARG